MNAYWQELLYPLGFLSAIAFSSRMLLQWISSEVKQRSTVMPAFWKLSLCGNILLALHAFIQMQFHVYIIQICNGLVSWRNLNLMQSQQSLSFRQTIKLFIPIFCIAALLFLLQNLLFTDTQEWFRIPSLPWKQHIHNPLALSWHVLGFLGLILFNSRFWIQWWCAEKKQQSYLGPSFWWISLIGESLCLIYFLRINDPVNFIGPLVAMVPYARNLMLLHKRKKQESIRLR